MPISDLLASISGDGASPRLAVQPPAISHKRKAEDDLRGNNGIDRKSKPTGNTARPVHPIRTQSTDAPNSKSNPVSGKPPTQAQSTSRPTSTPRPLAKTTPSTTTVPTAANAPANTPAKAPKKGSFAEIMARAKTATPASGIGQYQHKPIEKPLSRVTKEEQKTGRLASSKPMERKVVQNGSKVASNGRDIKAGARETIGKGATKAPEPEKKVKKAALATTGYTGTARPVNGKSSRPASRPADRYRGNSRRDEYESEEDENEELEEEEDYYSDASSDMEAATFEVDEEEERAARIARKEDAEALNEENRLKREKEEKRKRLAAMVKARQR